MQRPATFERNASVGRSAWTLALPECLMEAAGLCSFMVSACAFGMILFHPEIAVASSAATSPRRPNR